MKTVRLKRLAAQRVRQGNPLLVAQDFVDPKVSALSELVHLVDDAHEFLGTAIIGSQHKAAGWVVSRRKLAVLDESFWVTLLAQAARRRHSMRRENPQGFYRLFHEASDGCGGMTIDVYATQYAVISWYHPVLYRSADTIVTALRRAVPDIQTVYQKMRMQPALPAVAESSLIVGESAPHPLYVSENGVQYAVYLDDGLMTGVFADQRTARAFVQKHATGKKVLNTFSYTGAFSVAAARGGASRTVSVDVANRSLERTKEQFAINGIDASEHSIYVMDTFDYLAYAQRKQERFDWIILDPPSFARTKKRTFSVTQHYGDLVTQALAVLNPNGWLLVSTNAANWPRSAFLQTIDTHIAAAGWQLVERVALSLPEDFPIMPQLAQSDYLKCYACRLIPR